jgi:hypothetical protein
MTSITYPQWIAKMHAGKVGRDHLGLGSVSSDQILPRLSPGINVLTTHPRYHSFYAFLLDEFWRQDRVRSQIAWMEFFRPREFIFSVGVFLCDRPEHREGIAAVGSRKTEPLANQRLPVYDTRTHYIDSELGGYGLYYRSVMAELGLIFPGGPGFPYPIDVPTEQGKRAAELFRQAIQHTRYYHDYFDHDVAEVPIGIIQDYIRHACLCQLQVPTAPDHTFLLDTFLHGGGEQLAFVRRETFRLLLDIAIQTQERSVDQDTFRQLLYFQAAENGAIYHPQPSVETAYKRWRLYQAREYYAFALNALWKYLCTWGVDQGGDMHPLPLGHFWQHLREALDFNALATHLRLPAPALGADDSFADLLQWIQTVVGSDQAGFDAVCTLDAPIQEQKLYRLALGKSTEPHVMVAGMILLLSLIYLRFGRPERWRDPAWEISRLGQDGRLSLADFIQTLRRRLERRSTTLREVTQWLYDDYIILQHQLVAASKSPENTFRFQREGNRLRFYHLENPLGFMDSRFGALSTIVQELGLCGDLAQPVHPLTAEGQLLLAEGDVL